MRDVSPGNFFFWVGGRLKSRLFNTHGTENEVATYSPAQDKERGQLGWAAAIAAYHQTCQDWSQRASLLTWFVTPPPGLAGKHGR